VSQATQVNLDLAAAVKWMLGVFSINQRQRFDGADPLPAVFYWLIPGFF